MTSPLNTSGNPYAAPEAPITPIADDPLTPHLASLGWRFVAFVIDYVVFIGIIYGLTSIAMVIMGYGPPEPFGSTPPRKAFGDGAAINILVPSLLWACYFAIQESSRWQASLGKRITRLRIVGQDLMPLSFNRSLARALIMLFGLTVLYLGLIPALFTRRRQGLHDWLTGTVVVRATHGGPISDE